MPQEKLNEAVSIDASVVRDTAYQIRSDAQLVKGLHLREVLDGIEKTARSNGFDPSDFEADVLAYGLKEGLIEVDEQDRVLAPERPEQLELSVKAALANTNKELAQDVRKKVPESKQVRPWHVVEGVKDGFVILKGEKVRLDPVSLRVTHPDKKKHASEYFSGMRHQLNAYLDYQGRVGVEAAVHPYEWQIRGWLEDRDAGVPLTNSSPKVREHRRAKAALCRVLPKDLYGDYWVEESEA